MDNKKLRTLTIATINQSLPETPLRGSDLGVAESPCPFLRLSDPLKTGELAQLKHMVLTDEPQRIG